MSEFHTNATDLLVKWSTTRDIKVTFASFLKSLRYSKWYCGRCLKKGFFLLIYKMRTQIRFLQNFSISVTLSENATHQLLVSPTSRTFPCSESLSKIDYCSFWFDLKLNNVVLHVQLHSRIYMELPFLTNFV